MPEDFSTSLLDFGLSWLSFIGSWNTLLSVFSGYESVDLCSHMRGAVGSFEELS